MTRRHLYHANAVLSFCVLARRLCTVCRWCDLKKKGGFSKCALSTILFESLEYFNKNFGVLLEEVRENTLRDCAVVCAGSIEAAGEPLDSYFGFIGGTKCTLRVHPGLRNLRGSADTKGATR